MTASILLLALLLPSGQLEVSAKTIKEKETPAETSAAAKKDRKRKWRVLPFSSRSNGQDSGSGKEADRQASDDLGAPLPGSSDLPPAEIKAGRAQDDGQSNLENKAGKFPAVQSNLKKPQVGSSSKTSGLAPKEVPLSAQLRVLPFLVKGRNCTLSVTDSEGKPVVNAGVYLDEELFCSDERGMVSFTVPDTELFQLSLLGEGKRKICKHRFVCGADKIFSESDKLSDLVSCLLRTDNTVSGAPAVIYAPAVLAPGEPFVIVGHNLSESYAGNCLDIDGLSARILSASREGILALAPAGLAAGPSREMFITVNGEASNSVELDVARPFFTHTRTETDDVSPEKGKIGMTGTSLPCLLHVRNNDQDRTSLWSPKQEPLGKNNVLLSPGGKQNSIDIDVRLSSPGVKPELDLSVEQEIDATGDLAPPQLMSSLGRAEIMALERKRIAVRARLDDLVSAGESPGAGKINSVDGGASTSDSSAFEKRVLSMRLRRLSSMLAARRAIYAALGNTDAQYRQALDDAANGALFTLEQSVKPIQVVSDGSVGMASGEFGPVRFKKGRPLRLLEPAIRLLPPLSDAELAALNSKSQSSVPPRAPEKPPASDEPSLRPGLPEPEPEVSAESRATSGENQSGKAPLSPGGKKKGTGEASRSSSAVGKAEEKKKPSEKAREKKEPKKSHKKAKSESPAALRSKGKHGRKNEQASSKKSARKSRHGRPAHSAANAVSSGAKRHRRHSGRRHG